MYNMKKDGTTSFKSEMFHKFPEYDLNGNTGVLIHTGDGGRLEFKVEFMQELEHHLITTGNLVKAGMVDQLTPSDKFVLMVLDKSF
jgi:hypothetical protein